MMLSVTDHEYTVVVVF